METARPIAAVLFPNRGACCWSMAIDRSVRTRKTETRVLEPEVCVSFVQIDQGHLNDSPAAQYLAAM